MLRNSDAMHRIQILRIGCRLLTKQGISAGQPVRPQLALEISDPCFIGLQIVRSRQQLEPDRIEFQSLQPEHPLQRHRKISAAFKIFRREPAAQKDGHASRMVILLACSRLSVAILEDFAVRQMRLAMILMAGAKSAVRDRDNRAEELRLLSHI